MVCVFLSPKAFSGKSLYAAPIFSAKLNKNMQPQSKHNVNEFVQLTISTK